MTSYLRHPKGNRKSEVAVKIAKNLFNKTKMANEDMFLALLVWHNTPTEGLSSNPAQPSFCRHLKGRVPMSQELLKQQSVDWKQL